MPLLLKQCVISLYRIPGDGITIADMFRYGNCISMTLNVIFLNTAAKQNENKILGVAYI